MIDEYKTITDTIGEGYYTEKRSKFLAFAHHVTSVDEVKTFVREAKKVLPYLRFDKSVEVWMREHQTS